MMPVLILLILAPVLAFGWLCGVPHWIPRLQANYKIESGLTIYWTNDLKRDDHGCIVFHDIDNGVLVTLCDAYRIEDRRK